MAKTVKNIFDEKVSLIYEYNKKSPLFVREANTEIFANNVEKAVEILRQGLRLFPNYPTAYIVLAKALTMLGEYDEALSSYKKGCKIINSDTSFAYFEKEVASTQKQRSAFGRITRRPLTFEQDFSDEIDSLGGDGANFQKLEKTFEDNLGELAERISAVKIPAPSDSIYKEEEEESDFPSEVKIASETLAKIYVAQGEFKEA
ncbi:MAG: hypothetical protein COT22_14015, partial [Ignavibacteria bacterium CG08_land_8_20_14_0_20_37_9]